MLVACFVNIYHSIIVTKAPPLVVLQRAIIKETMNVTLLGVIASITIYSKYILTEIK